MRPDLESGEENPYEFIFSQDKQALPGNGKPGKLPGKKIILFGLFTAVTLTVAIIVGVTLFAPEPPSAPALERVRAWQNEIIRVTDIGDKNIVDFDLKKDVSTLNLTIKTDSGRVNKLITARQVVVPIENAFTQAMDSGRDQRLKSSLDVDSHDTVFREIMDEMVAGYYNAVRSAESTAQNTTEQQELATVKRNIEISYIDESVQETPASQDTPAEESEPTLTN